MTAAKAPPAEAATRAALSFKAVTKFYERSHLGRTTRTRGIDNVTFDIRPGEVFGLLGLNGSGKTTTMKLALGLLKPTSGAVSVFDKPAGSRDALREMGYLPELPYFYPYLNPIEALAFFGELSAIKKASLREKIDHAIDRVGLTAARNRRMSEFSKGMLQRVGMAQALLHDPRLIVLDEPVSGLDPLAIAEFRELLAKLNEEGRTLLLSSHSISEVERLCHRAAILVEGRLVRILEQKYWSKEPGLLEKMFVDTVQKRST